MIGTVPNATILTPTQIRYYAQSAGFSGNDLDTAVAVAMAESSGNPMVYNPETAAGTPDGEGSYGLWQIYLHAHPEFAFANLYDPQINANAAYAIYSAAGGFSPWSTYNSGAYQAYLAPAAAANPAATAPIGLTALDPSSTEAPSASPFANLSMTEVMWIAGLGLLGVVAMGLFD
jgi:hypothetical protein